jgi:hypothetical protein
MSAKFPTNTECSCYFINLNGENALNLKEIRIFHKTTIVIPFWTAVITASSKNGLSFHDFKSCIKNTFNGIREFFITKRRRIISNRIIFKNDQVAVTCGSSQEKDFTIVYINPFGKFPRCW